ncbi:MAG TPA: class I SAM-dependent methyltransferase [Mycobacteriales bacterium]|nr:class I SAM-dependent methyltransferase [Mycobacteriales bacterium]
MDQTRVAPRSVAVAALFDRVAESYENVGVPWFDPIGAALVRAVAPAGGERALDIGCGRGAVLFPLADAVGPAGRVTGIDLSAAMVERTAADVRARGLTTVDLQVMDAAGPDLPPGSYDLALSSLVIFFLPDPAGALRAWRELLVPGGRLGISTFGPRDRAWEDLDDIFRPYLPQQLLDARTSGQSGPFGSDRGVEELLGATGFTHLRTTGLDVPVTFQDPEQWRVWSWSHGQRVMWECVPEARRDEVMAAATEHLEVARGADGRITLNQHVRLSLGDRLS